MARRTSLAEDIDSLLEQDPEDRFTPDQPGVEDSDRRFAKLARHTPPQPEDFSDDDEDDEPEDWLDGEELVVTFMDSTRGRDGDQLLALAKVLGYPSLAYFFDDNPGAVEAVTNFVIRYVGDNPEWEDALRVEYDDDDYGYLQFGDGDVGQIPPNGATIDDAVE